MLLPAMYPTADTWLRLMRRSCIRFPAVSPHKSADYNQLPAEFDPDTGRHYHYQPKNKDSGQPLELDPATVRKHLAGWITIGLYAINSQSQRCKWIAIDADYDDAFFDLG